MENLWARVENFRNLGDTVAQSVPRRALGRPVRRRTRELLYAASPRDVLILGYLLNSVAEPADVPPMRPHARRPSVVAVLFIAVLVTAGGLTAGPRGSGFGFGARPAGAASAPPTDSTDPATADAYRALAIQVSRNNAMLTQLSTQLDATTQRLAELAAAIVDTQQKLDTARAESARLVQVVRDRAAYIYRNAHQPQIAVGDIANIEDVASGQTYAEVATRTDAGRITELNRQADALDAKRKDLESQRAQQQSEHDRLDNAKIALTALTTRQQKVLDEAGAIPVMGDAELTADEVNDWFTARGAKYRLSGNTSMKDLVTMYFEEGAAEHVRPELAFAQSIIETGSFGHALDNNYGGIGACDSCDGEIVFPTPRDGVRGQIQLLKTFADPSSRAAALTNPPSPQIFGQDPGAAAASFDNYVLKGRIPTWNLMGNGNWATDPTYASKVLVIYFDMITFAAKRS